MKKYSAFCKSFLFLIGLWGGVQSSFAAGANSSWEMTSPLDPQHQCHQFVHHTFLGKLDDGTTLIWGMSDFLDPFSNTGTILSVIATEWSSSNGDNCSGLAALFDNGEVDTTGASAGFYDPNIKLPSDFPKDRKVISIAATAGAFAALLEDNHSPYSCNLKVWGNPYLGGTQPKMIVGKKVAAIASCYDGFVALCQDGTLQSWGGPDFEGNPPPDFPKGKKVIALASSCKAFVALFEDGTIFSWGSPIYGGLLPKDFPKGRPVESIASSQDGFALLFKDGGVYSWDISGRTLPADFPTSEKVTAIAATAEAFTALFESGHVYSWGLEEYGGKLPDSFPQQKIVSFGAGDTFFVAQFDDQTTAVWGGFQGDYEPLSEKKVISIATSDEAIALLYEDGTISTMGNEFCRGKEITIPDGKKVISIQGKSMSPPLIQKSE